MPSVTLGEFSMLSRLRHRQSRPWRPARAVASTSARAAIGVLLAAAILAACGGGATTTPGASSGAAASAPWGAPANSPANAASSPATASPTASTGTGTHTGAIPSDQCSVVTRADVEAAFGGSSSAGKIDENGHCAFEVSGTIHAGPNVSVPGFVGVSFVDRYTIYDTAKLLFGDAVTKVDGLGTDAWYALTAVHAKVAGGELVVSGLWVGNFNRDTLKADTITLAKTILARP
jgi:hypothetical protein